MALDRRRNGCILVLVLKDGGSCRFGDGREKSGIEECEVIIQCGSGRLY
jgi:hypothetical protein